MADFNPPEAQTVDQVRDELCETNKLVSKAERAVNDLTLAVAMERHMTLTNHKDTRNHRPGDRTVTVRSHLASQKSQLHRVLRKAHERAKRPCRQDLGHELTKKRKWLHVFQKHADRLWRELMEMEQVEEEREVEIKLRGLTI